MATISAELQQFATQNGVPEPYCTWLASEGVRSPEDLGIAATKEEQVEAKLITPAKSGGVTINTLGDSVKITMLWRACRVLVERAAEASGGQPVAMDTP
eukprot:5180196-Pyramimonas_sp.AAC.1